MKNFKRKLAVAGVVGGLVAFTGCRDNDNRAVDERDLKSETERTRIESDDVQREGSHDLSGGPAEGTGGSGPMESRGLEGSSGAWEERSPGGEQEGSHDLSGGPAEEGTGGSGDEVLGGELPETGEGSETHRELSSGQKDSTHQE